QPHGLDPSQGPVTATGPAVVPVGSRHSSGPVRHVDRDTQPVAAGRHHPPAWRLCHAQPALAAEPAAAQYPMAAAEHTHPPLAAVAPLGHAGPGAGGAADSPRWLD